MAHLLPDFPPGPLDYYRKKASFDWKKLKIFLETEEIVKYQHDLYEILSRHPEYKKDLLSYTFDEERHKATRQAIALKGIDLLNTNAILQDIKREAASLRVMMQFNAASAMKNSVGVRLFTGAIRSLGTERHQHIIEACEDGEFFGCFCLTEIGHGTNTKGMRTTATYDKDKQQFIMHSPDFEAAKCWAGALGQLATYAVVFAQLYSQGVHHGLHALLVPIRDPKTLRPYPGILVGDMGEKIGLNGVDNGFLMFDHYHIPRESLLNKTGDITVEGDYITPYKDPKARFGASLGNLSVGRVNITGNCEAYGTKALTIAIRYAGVRKQFGPDGQGELPILEYQTHQHRLLPYLAAAYVIRTFSSYLITVTYQFNVDSSLGRGQPDLGMEIHVVSSASKPVAGWTFRDAIRECREACGGHGYLKIAGIGDIRNQQDACCTYEGENHVLIQQTSNYLVKLWPQIEKGEKISSPLKSVDFLSNGLQILRLKFTATNLQQIVRPENIMNTYRWLVCYYLRETKNKLETLKKQGQDEFWSKNNVQVFYAKNLGITFIQHFFLQYMLSVIEQATDPNIKAVLLKLFSLYGLWSLEKFIPTLYQGGYAKGPKATYLIQEGILKLCSEIKDDAVSLIDAIAPPDFVLDSVLGASDGQVYKRLQTAMFQSPYAMSRPSWWQDIVNWKTNIRTKL